MFDFEKLEVYQLIREINTYSYTLISKVDIDLFYKDQWKRSNLSSLLNLCEGVGRVTPSDKKHFITISRGSVFESVALLNTLKDMKKVSLKEYTFLYEKYEQASKMLLGMYRSIN